MTICCSVLRLSAWASESVPKTEEPRRKLPDQPSLLQFQPNQSSFGRSHVCQDFFLDRSAPNVFGTIPRRLPDSQTRIEKIEIVNWAGAHTQYGVGARGVPAHLVATDSFVGQRTTDSIKAQLMIVVALCDTRMQALSLFCRSSALLAGRDEKM